MEIGESIGDYTVCSVLGEGGFGRVLVVRDRHGEECVLKMMRQERQNSEMEFEKLNELLSNEVASMKVSDHENVVQLIEVFQRGSWNTDCCIVMEKCDTDLYKWLRGGSRKRVLSEFEARWALSQVACGLRSIRQNDFIHRDLKPSNLLLKMDNGEEPDSILSYTVKLGDFGLSRALKEDEQAHTLLGTKFYMAPETLSRNYSSSVDMYSFGVIACELLTGETPSWSVNQKGSCIDLDAILSRCPSLSESARSFLRGTIAFVDTRMQWDEFFRHEWIRKDIELQECINRVKQYASWIESVDYVLQKAPTSFSHCFYIAISAMEICYNAMSTVVPSELFEPRDQRFQLLNAVIERHYPVFCHLMGRMLEHAKRSQHAYQEITPLFRRIINYSQSPVVLVPHFASILFEEVIHLRDVSTSANGLLDNKAAMHARRCLLLILDVLGSSDEGHSHPRPCPAMTDGQSARACSNRLHESNVRTVRQFMQEISNASLGTFLPS
ncbi:serine/threonine-protein kinase atg1-like [Schistocerca gregaria]|uniref:serine/threonine-protein kinase atg1-like n=1 Tax=Schistocerca gregaria TaxID=7010 RepID=UPI00211E9C98|nr:serine/threonine-protein kinase atg1-like [Schistocerca gregaria]